MNALEEWLIDNCVEPVKAMDILQDAGVVSDLCVTPADVADTDVTRAILFLNVALERPLL